MKVSSVEAYPFSQAVRPGVVIRGAGGEHRTSRYVIVVIQTDDGLTGFGEATVMPGWSGETQCSAVAAIRDVLAPLLVGEDPLLTEQIAIRMDSAIIGNAFAKAAVEMALLDLGGKALGVPANVLLGGRCREGAIPLKGSVGAFSPSEAAAIAETFVSWGLSAVKIKVGLNVREDLKRVQAVRSALGAEFPIAVDANTRWSEGDARSALSALERLGVNALEQPLAREDFAGCARLRQRTSIPLMLDESIFTVQDALEAIRQNACDLISIYPGKNGGMRRSMTIAQMAASAGIDCVIGSNLEFEIASAAMLHLAVAIPNLATTMNHDIIGPLYYPESVTTQPLLFEQGRAVLPDGPGLGVDMDPGRLTAEGAR